MPHATVIPWGEGIWLVDGDRVRMLGIPFTTRMTVIRLADGGLWLHSPVAPAPERVAAVSALGPVRHLTAPNLFHHLFLGPWQALFPDASCWAGPGLARRRPDLRFAATLGETPEAAWAGDIDQMLFTGSVVLNEALFLHRQSRSLLVTDIVQNHDPAGETRLWRWVKGVNRCLAPHGEAPRDWRLTVRDRAAARASLERLLTWDFDRVVLCHGCCVEQGGRAFIERAFAWLGPVAAGAGT